MSEDRKIYWVALNFLLSDRPYMIRKVAASFPDLRDFFRTSSLKLQSLGLDEGRINAVTSSKVLDSASRELEKIAKKKYFLLTMEDELYPPMLREVFDPPFVLYGAGEPATLRTPCVAIVGTRTPSPYGRAVAEKLAEDLASRGITIVSGLARGIDSISHAAALRNGKTVAVLGSGLEAIYPRENKKLSEKIIEKGTVISEFPLDAEPLFYHFPQRNRIISGLSLATVIVEASDRSGSLITARLALEQGREVMAVPGNITSEESRGANWLIKNGAKLVESWRDVAEELPSPVREKILSAEEGEPKKEIPLSLEEKKIWELLRPDSLIHVDDLAEKTEFSISNLLSILLQLELKGLIVQTPGKYFQRRL